MASVTGWLNKYRSDLFFRTEVRVMALQIAFLALILGFFTIAVYLIGKEASRAIEQVVVKILGEQAPPTLAPTLVSTTTHLRWINFLLYIMLVVPATVIISYFIAKITLSPVRGALNSQKKFVGNIAHELRTPLSVIKTNNEIALLSRDIPQDLRDTVQSSNEELDRISAVINNLLSISTLVSPEQMKFNTINLAVLATDVIQKLSELANRRQINIVFRDGSHGYVWGNLSALQQIVGNLIKNAINFTPERGTITVMVSEVPSNQTELVVQDTGVGISRKDLRHIFEPFYRADVSRASGNGGSGLGLTIVSELVKIHHGKIQVQSAVGVGTKVSILLPGVPIDVVNSHSDIHEISQLEVDFR